MASSRDPKPLWANGYVSLNAVPNIIRQEWPLYGMSFPVVRQAVADKALKVIEIGNQMRVTRESLEAFIKVVEEGHYVPSSNPSKAHWLVSTIPEDLES